MIVLILVFGFLFGAILQYASLNKYNVISGLAMLKNLSVIKAIALAIGVGIILLNIEIYYGLASLHIKPFMLGGLLFGGLIFGSGMAILGYCPGTLAISFGEGSLDAFLGILGGLLGGFVFTLALPFINPILGPDLGTMSLRLSIESNTLFHLLSTLIAIAFILSAFGLQKIDQIKGKKWIFAGIALAVLNSVIFLTALTNRPIGASTTFPYLADLISGLTANNYFSKIKVAGNWELIFLAGSFLAGLSISLIKKEFKFVLIYENWKNHKGTSSINRSIWAFVGGFILIFGARMASGCTSGHILSGGMQLAYSSLFFTVTTFVGLLITGKLFYKQS